MLWQELERRLKQPGDTRILKTMPLGSSESKSARAGLELWQRRFILLCIAFLPLRLAGQPRTELVQIYQHVLSIAVGVLERCIQTSL